jgi:hypothetical protein
MYVYVYVCVCVCVYVCVSPVVPAGAEDTRLTLLDIVKHAMRTVLHTLGEHDRVAIVGFESEAKVHLLYEWLGGWVSVGGIRIYSVLHVHESMHHYPVHFALILVLISPFSC